MQVGFGTEYFRGVFRTDDEEVARSVAVSGRLRQDSPEVAVRDTGASEGF